MFPRVDTVPRMKRQTATATVYTLRVDVTVPHTRNKPDYSAQEIRNRAEAALRYVPGDCTVQVLEYSDVEE